MAIEVEGPDGAVVEFPDGTDQATIQKAMQGHYGGPPSPRARNWSTPSYAPIPQTTAKPSLFRMDSDFAEKGGVGPLAMLSGAARDTFAGRENAAEYLAGKAGGKADVDNTGAPIVTLPSGESYRLNDPGLDLNDVASVGSNIGAFLIPAGAATKLGQARNLGTLSRGALQAGTAAATDAALQAGVTGGDVDLGRTAAAAAGGAGGEVLGTGVGAAGSKLAALSRRTSGANTRNALELLADAGVGSPPPPLLARLAGGMEEVRAGADPNAILGRELYGFQYTLGQRMKDPVQRFDQLSREEVLRQAPGAGGVFDAANRANRERLGEAVDTLGQKLGGRPGATPAELAQGAAGKVRQQADALDTQIGEAYEKAGQGARTAVGTDAVAALPGRLRAAVADFGVDPQLHPAASRTLAQVREAAGQVAQGDIKGVTLKAIETQRRIINNNVAAAANPSDRAATLAIKREFDGWLDDAVETALVSGDPAALQALKDARQLRFEYGRRFEGKAEADKFIAGLLDGSRTPEELVNIALGAGQVSKAGGARFIERLRVAADNDPEVIGALRAAHFQRLALGRNGEPLGMGKIVSNIKATEYGNASVVKALYTPAEWAEIKSLANSLEPLIAKGDFARTSGSGERVARMLMSKMGGGVPVLGDMVVKPIQAGVNYSRATNTLNKPLRLPGRVPRGFVPASAATMQEVTR
ncbi:hypothetical protein [Pseudoxanthomonas koreensis]|uniref:hypothetical protein n=1 Tax=Pseudoxanthomonas koreensis TaxID=266061 RepID=UPI001391984F|nr:hypothetical protein [Pseudoxanthomonas koreensis]KAF1692650.1 hypothetical protein CSC64_06590 [Pseudoxanthomonas koreensis]